MAMKLAYPTTNQDETWYTLTFNKHTTIITVNIVVNNVVLQNNNKQPISETRRCRVTKLGDGIETSKSDHTNM